MKKIYSTKAINLTSLIITTIIFLSLNIFIKNYLNTDTKEIEEKNIQIQSKTKEKNKEKLKEEIEEETEEANLEWYIEIPSINLKAPIKESTNMDILNKFVGHFKETSLTIGNVGLAGHNRGYEKNYFENLKQLKKGEEIKYRYKEYKKTYIIDIIETIKETNWSYLENTKENKITLITCIENKPEYRRCIQATEKRE